MTDPDLSHIDPDAKKAELEQDAEHAKRQAKQEEAELLAAVENEEEFEHESYRWVEIGDVEFKVREWMAGEVIDAITQYVEADTEADIPDFTRMLNAAKIQTEVIRTGDVSWSTDAKIDAFWDSYYQKHGSTVLDNAFEIIFNPAINQMGGRVPDSFPGEQSGDGFRDGVSHNGQ
jgi:hypothetical protein